MTDLDTIKERHHEVAIQDDGTPLCLCDLSWPCDTRVVLDSLDEKAQGYRLLVHNIADLLSDETAARADADRLDEALDHTITHAEHYECDFRWCVDARAALAKHLEATK